MPLTLPVPTYLADNGPNVKHAKPWYRDLLRAHAEEMNATFDGALSPVPATSTDTTWISTLPTPSVLILPAVCGGWVEKDWSAWWAFCKHLLDYRAAGGVVVCLDKAFNLPADGKKAKGRGWEGFQSDSALPGVGGDVTFSYLGTDGAAAHSGQVEAHALRVWAEWRRDDRSQDAYGREVAWVSDGKARVPVAWRWSREGWEQPGAMLFVSCWGWTRRNIEIGRPWVRDEFNREVIDSVLVEYRRLNRTLVASTVADVFHRTRERIRRLEHLAGETVRLPRRVGREKDYHRLLVNDVELCVDIIGWRELVGEDHGGVSSGFRSTFRDPAVVNEPGHFKTHGTRGRLDILLAADARASGFGDRYLRDAGRAAVAWIELEAGEINLGQIKGFVGGQRRTLRKGDYVCAVDRSDDTAPGVIKARALTEATGATFLHARVPHVFSRLEEAYAPDMHRLSRKRYALEVIRGLLG